MTEPTFSIVVPSMGRPDLLAALVKGISENSGDGKGELCVGLDRMVIEPSPESLAVLRDLDGPTTWWSVAGRPGMSAAMNTAVSLASGSWIVIIADDMVPMTNWLDLRFDGPGQFMSKDRILCFDLLEPRPGSFPPHVPAGDTPETFDGQKAEAAAFYRLLNCDARAKPGRFFVGACVLHRSKWLPWPEWTDPYCLSPETRVLTAGLLWKSIGDMRVGDSLVGFDETTESRKWGRRALRKTTVSDVWNLRRRCHKIRVGSAEIVASDEHLWLVESPKMNGLGWLPTSQLRPGKERLCLFARPWTADTSHAAGYLAAALDGEGWIRKGALGFPQNPGLMLERVVDTLQELGFVKPGRRGGLVRARKRESSRGIYTIQIGTLAQIIELLGRIRPSRLLATAEKAWVGVQPWYERHAIESVEDVGRRDVVGIETETRTFFAEGYASHNSCNDIAWMWETHLAHPDVAWGWMPGNCVYHFQSAAVKSFGIRAPEDTAQRFHAHYGLAISEAYEKIYRHSEAIWQRPGAKL